MKMHLFCPSQKGARKLAIDRELRKALRPGEALYTEKLFSALLSLKSSAPGPRGLSDSANAKELT